MKLLSSYLAGIADADGSFQLQIQIRQNGSFRINPRFVIGLIKREKERKFLKKVKITFRAGRYYEDKKTVRFWTTNVKDTIKVCETLEPYLQLKKKQCQQLLGVCKLIKSKKNKRYIKGYLTKSKDIYTKTEMLKIVKIATTMNAGMQTNRFRKSMGRDTQYYINKINEIYA